MAKQLNVNLSVTADTSNAKKNLADLQTSLANLNAQARQGQNFGLSKDIQEAKAQVSGLQAALKSATDVNTGKLDLSKFSQSLKASNLDIDKCKNALMQMGPQGAQAFSQLVSSINSADVRIKKVNSTLLQFKNTLVNTARWQVSSSILHGFMGAVQSAYGYAQDLNESLNNIRIVTGQNIDQMAKFAQEANKAAKALSATTTEYTNASLIYYQQGLNDQQVKERTDVTIKMANVARESAETVSDQMTAVWNNFYDGSKSLEYYADVMTALGAATASSTAEISEGLNKFAAVAETVGLSYEYATAALATVTATTRQSADVVGTAFKTLFARIQDLELGNTLDDGTTLGSYSQALEKVGINIIDTSGNLKQMDVILEEMAARWDALGQAEQTALAQNVAGVRQYTQLIALMENWDFMQKNLNTANNASGALDEQHEIYAEGWEAASDRVRAAAEEIYSSLIDDDFFIGLLDSFKEILEFVDLTIESMGGLQGVLTSIGALLIQVFQKQLSSAIHSAGIGIKNFNQTLRGGSANNDAGLKQEATKAMINYSRDADTQAGYASETVFRARGKMMDAYLSQASRLTEIEKEQMQYELDRQEAAGQALIDSAQRVDQAQKELQIIKEKIGLEKSNYSGVNDYRMASFDAVEHLGSGEAKATGAANFLESMRGKKLDSTSKEAIYGTEGLLSNALDTDVIDGLKLSPKADKEFKELFNKIQEIKNNPPDIITQEEINQAKELVQQIEKAKTNIVNETVEQSTKGMTPQAQKKLRGALEQSYSVGQGQGQVVVGMAAQGLEAEEFKERLNGLDGQISSTSDKMVAMAGVATTLSMGFNMLKGTIDTLKNPDATGWEKFTSILMTMGMLIPMVVSTTTSLSKAFTNVGVKGVVAGAGATVAGAGEKVAGEGAKKATPKILGFGAALNTALGPVGWIAIALTALIGILVLVSSQMNKEEKAAQKATKAVEALSEAHQQVNKQIEKLETAFKAYDTAIDKLDECTKGSQAWNDALQEVNKTVTQLLIDMPELLTYDDLFVRDENGILTINQQRREEIMQELDEAKSVTESALLVAQGLKTKADNAVYEKSVKNEIGYRDVNQQNDSLESQEVIFDNIDMGKLVLANIEQLARAKSEEDFVKKITEILRQNNRYTDYNTAQTIGENLYKDYYSQIVKIESDRNKANLQINQAADYAVNKALQGQGYGAAEEQLASTEYLENIDKEYDEVLKILKSQGQGAKAANSAVQALWEEYVDAVELQVHHVDSNFVRGNKNNRKFAYYENATDEKAKEIDAETIAQTLAATRALEGLGDSAKKAAQAVQEMTKKVGNIEVAKGIQNWIVNGNFDSMSEGEFKTWAQKKWDWEPTLDYIRDTVFGGKYTDEQIMKHLGVDSMSEVFNLFTGAIENTLRAYDNVAASLTTTAKNFFYEFDRSTLNLFQQEALVTTIRTIFGNKGAEGLNTLLTAFESATDKKEFVQYLADTDWTSITLEQFEQDCLEFGIAIETDFQLLFEGLRELSKSTVETATNNYKTQHDIIKNLKSFGDTISAEDYKKLGEGYEQYFTLMADGSYKLITDAKTFYDLVHKNTIQKFTDVINTNQDLLNNYHNNIDGLSQSKAQNGNLRNSLLNMARMPLRNIPFDNTVRQIEFSPANDFSQPNDLNSIGKMLNVLEFMGVKSKDVLQEWKLNLQDNSIAIKTAYDEWLKETPNAQELMDNKYNYILQEIAQANEAIASSYSTVEEVMAGYGDGKNGTFTGEPLYQNTLRILAEQEEIKGLDTEELKEYSEYLQSIANSDKDIADNLSTEAANSVAKATLKANEGITELTENYQNWLKVLTDDTKKGTIEHQKALNSLISSISKLFGVSERYITSDFIETNKEAIQAIINGQYDNIETVRKELANTVLSSIINDEEILSKAKQLSQTIQESLATSNIEIGAELNLKDNNELKQWSQDLISTAKMTTEQANAYFDALGYDVKFLMEPQTYSDYAPKTETHTTTKRNYISNDTWEDTTTSWTEVVDYIPVENKRMVVAMGTDGKTPQIETITRKSNANAQPPQTSSSSSKGSKASGTRYQRPEHHISTAEHNQNRLSGQALVNSYDPLINGLRDKLAEARGYISETGEDTTNLLTSLIGIDENYFKVNGQLSIDTLLAHYDDIMNSLTTPEAKQAFQEALGTWLETDNIIAETEDAISDAFFSQLKESLDNKLKIEDNRLEEIDLMLKHYGDSYDKMADSMELMFNPDKNDDQFDSYDKQLQYYKQTWDDLARLYNNGNGVINQAKYLEGLENMRDGMKSGLESLIDLNKAMSTYYEDTLSKGKEELADYTDHLSHLTSITEHYKNILGLLGKEQNYRLMRNVANANTQMLENELTVAKNYYDSLKQQREEWQKQVAETEARYNATHNEDLKIQLEYEKAQLDAIVDATDEAQSEMFALTENWIEAEKALLEIELEELASELEKQLVGSYNTFDNLMDQFDKLNARQEEYLTETNKMYETNKMMAEANKLLDETTNKAAKQKISNFVNETKKLQQNTQLSEFELELQQAKYDLLLAEIALEEARGAKSTVRLTRDNEGNFGYVYTADQEAIFDAEQKVAEAENKLYNKSLDGQKNYTEKYLQAAQEMFEEIKALNTARLEGEITSEEEYNLKKQAILEHYFHPDTGILRTYSSLYNLAAQSDTKATADNHLKQYESMINDVDKYQASVEINFKNAGDAIKNYNTTVSPELDSVTKAVEALTGDATKKTGLAGLIEESNALTDTIGDVKDGVIKSLNDEASAVSNLALKYGEAKSELQNWIKTYSDNISTINNIIETIFNPEQGGATPPPSTEPGPGDTEGGKGQTDDLYASNPKPGEIYTVKTGDTLGELYSKAYNKSYLTPSGQYTREFTEWAMLLNGITNPNQIYTGQTLRFNTGGYTGSWGPSAKLAWLDEKELVLNANDTENILRTVSFVRELANIIDSQASMSNISGFFTSPTIGNGNGTLEQKVDIHAEFPNATDRYEIEEAFTSLVNRASQYANRKW